MKACIIGAGASGIAACKVFQEHGIDFDCYEKGSDLGGLWWYGNDNGMSSIYKNLCINTSKQMMAYSDYPMPDDYPDYPGHALIHQYFKNYAEHFHIRNRIQFNTAVLSVSPKAGKYIVDTDKAKGLEYDAVIVCNGHHWNPKLATFEGKFSGEEMHSHNFKTAEPFTDKNVLVVGIGNSAVDIACEVSGVAKNTVISTRSGAYIVPKYLFGVPTDHISKPPLAYAPLALQRAALLASLLVNVGKQENYGVPTPKQPILSQHPTISQELLGKVGHGKIRIKPNIQRLDGKTVYFEDGSSENFDTIIYSTGYHITFPFFDKKFIDPKDNEMPLYHKVVHPEHPNLFFLGLIQPLGAIMPLSEQQAIWVANILTGKVQLPDTQTMQRVIERDREAMQDRYQRSTRHTVQVDFYPYKKLIRDEIRSRAV